MLRNLFFKISSLFFLIFTVNSQEVSKLIFAFNIGLSKPGSPEFFSENWGSGYNLGLGIGKSISSSFQLQVIFNFNNFSLNHPEFVKKIDTTEYDIDPDDLLYLTATGGERNILSLLTRIKYLYTHHGNSKIQPYGFIGIGIFREYIGKIQLSPSNIDIEKKTVTSFMMSFGIGTDLLLEEHTNLFFELAPEICFTESDTVVYYLFKIGFLVK